MCFSKENILQAKKDWELSHLQSLRAEEEKIAVEGEVDDIPFTYDRPDLSNKVTLRRSSTGMWKVCSSGHIQNNEEANYSNKEMRNGSRRKSALNADDDGTISNHVLRSGKSGKETASSVVSVYPRSKGPDYKPKASMECYKYSHSMEAVQPVDVLPLADFDYSNSNSSRSISKTRTCSGTSTLQTRTCEGESASATAPNSRNAKPRLNLSMESLSSHKYHTRQKGLLSR